MHACTAPHQAADILTISALIPLVVMSENMRVGPFCIQVLEMGAIPECAASLCSLLWPPLSRPDSRIEGHPLC